MPGFDRTGPTGMGPMTGRSAGPCNTSYNTDYYYKLRKKPMWRNSKCIFVRILCWTGLLSGYIYYIYKKNARNK